MLVQLGWVLGLGFIGLLLFGPVGGSVLGAIGFAIGSQKKHKTATTEPPAGPPAPAPVEQVPARSPGVDPGAPASSSRRGLVWFWIIVGGGIVLVYWLSRAAPAPPASAPQPGLEPMLASTRAPLVSASQAWSSEECLTQHFGIAIARGLVVPPEVRVFCGYPWDAGTLRALSQQLASQGLGPERMLDEFKPPPAQADFMKKVMAGSRGMPMPEGLLEIHDLMKVLPYVWGARADRAAWKPFLLKNFRRAYVEELASAAARIDWKKPLARGTLMRVQSLGDDAVLYMEHGTSLTTEEFVTLVIGTYDNRFDKVETNPLTQTLRSAKRSGLHAKHLQTVAMLTMFTGVLDGLADHLRETPALQAAWRPAKYADRRDSRPLEIFLTRAPIEGWCKGAKPSAHGQYCPSEDRVLIVDKREPSLDESGRDMALGMNAPIFHELAHAYLNPADADEYPFITEGLAMAFGERMMRATVAALPTSSELTLEQSAAFGRLFEIPSKETVSPAGSMQSKAERLEYARKHIERTRPTQYVETSLCRLKAQPLATGPVTTFLSQTSSTFASHNAEDMRLAYSYAWAIFNYGIDTAGIGLGVEGGQLDATAVQDAAAELSANRALNPALTERLDKFLSRVNARAQADLKKWKITCPS